MLDTDFRILQITRGNNQKLISTFTLEQLNIIPPKMNNNLIWNLGHVIVTQQILCYKLSGLPMHLDSTFIEKYKKGTGPNPDQAISQEEIDLLLKSLQSTQDQLKSDYANGVFQSYETYTTSYNMTLTSIEDAIRFNNVHEAMHLGTCLALKNLL